MFKKALWHTSQSAGSHGISDGKFSCTYNELPGIFERIDALMAECGMKPGDCPAFRCGNTVPAVIILLWLLDRQRDFVLLPRMMGKAQAELDDLNVPLFSKYKLTLEMDIDFKNPASYVTLQPNSTYNETAERNIREINSAGKVFFKTSGSTSEPKMALHSNENLTRNAGNCVERFRLQARDRVLIAVPVYHMYGFGAGLLPAVMAGASIRLIEQTDIIKLLEHEKQFQPHVAYLTPALIEMALRTRKSTYPYRLIVTAGDRINPASYVHFENKFGQLVNLYGSTELGAIATSHLDENLETRANSMVHVMPGVDVRLENEMAEILCQHDSGFDAYVDQEGKWLPGKTNGWFMTKDLGRIVSPGVFKVAGRTGNSINRSGILVSFMEVESLMEQGIAEIAHVVVTAREEETIRGKILVACCQLKPGTTMETAEIRSRCFAVMLRHMVPDEVLVWPEIPRLPNGKFDRKKITDTLNLKN